MSELTREQVDQAFSAVYWHADQQGTQQCAVLDGVDALRARLADLERENRNLKSTPTCVLSESGYMCSHCGTTLRSDNPDWSEIDALRARCAVLELGYNDQTAIRERHEAGYRETIAQLQATLAARENELCTAKDQIPPDMDEESLSVALIKLKDKRVELEVELEKWKLMQKHSIADECEAEQHLMDAGISDYEDGEHGEYRGLLTQIDLCIKERDAAVQEAGRLREVLEEIAEMAGYPLAQEDARNALKGA